MSTPLKDRVAIVTGGGRGIGKVISLRLARSGASVIICGTDQHELSATSAEIARLGRACLAVACDVSNDDAVANLAERTMNECGRIDCLVNNAGIVGPTAQVINISRAQWDRVLSVNLTGPFLCAKAVLPVMMAQKSGRIVNIASVSGRLAYPLRSPYAVSKWGLIGLTKTLAQEYGQYNIQVNAICPGPVKGKRMQQIIEDRAQQLGQSSEDVEQWYTDRTALKRMITAQDIAAMVSFLVSDDANNITGETFDVTAGYE